MTEIRRLQWLSQLYLKCAKITDAGIDNLSEDRLGRLESWGLETAASATPM